jgi:N-acetylmuramoyl-L-alanine amidase
VIYLKKISYVLIILFGISFFFIMDNPVSAFTNKNIIKGSTGNDVIELQARLQNIGYYRGKIDGIFYYETYWALRNFQKNFGMNVSGVADAKTKVMLTKASHYNQAWVLKQVNAGNEFTYYQGVPISKQVKLKSTKNAAAKKQTVNTATNKPTTGNKTTNTKNPVTTTTTNKKETIIPPGFSAYDIKLISNAVYGESRGEPYEGQVAVAAVILNRVGSASFPNSVSGVIFQPGAFTAVADGQIYLEPNKSAKKAVIDAINGWDPSANAIYYFNPATATNKWIWGRPQVKKIGKHIFCR